jgi:hypothetical protein
LTDPIVLAAQTRAVIENLHKRNDVVVRFKTNKSGYAEDELEAIDEEAPGHFKTDQLKLTLNLDTLLGSKPMPEKLDSLEDFRKYPVLAGVVAHESGHARWSRWGDLPESIPNPDYDPFDTSGENGENTTGPESFPVSETGKLNTLARLLEEPRIERLGSKVYTKTWRKAMQYSARHLILEQMDEMDENGEKPLEAALGMAIVVGGRLTAGTLGTTHESRKRAKKVMESAQKIIETALGDKVEDPYYKVMGIINQEVFNNDHDDPVSHLEAARQVLQIIHPEEAENPDKSSGSGSGGDGDDEGEEGPEGSEGSDPAVEAALSAMADAMRESMDDLSETMAEMVRSEEENPGGDDGGGHGSILYKNPEAPQIDHYEQPNEQDRELYHRAMEWMQRQIEPTVTEFERGQWLPVGGARLNIRQAVRDNIAGRKLTERTDWDLVSETVKPAPPVKVAIMLDGSGSMHSMARPSASIAWAAANAAAQLPESRTVSVVYGDAAQMTQQPGHVPARQIAVSMTNGGTESFIEAAKIVEDALWLDEPIEEGERTNVLVIVISDLNYGGEHYDDNGRREKQFHGFLRITDEWAARGYQTVVVGARSDVVSLMMLRGYPIPKDYDPAHPGFTIAQPKDLFR